MRTFHLIGAICVATSLSSMARDKPSQDDVLAIPRDGIVDAQVNGFPARLQVRGDGLSYPVLNADSATKFGLRANALVDVFGIGARVGDTTIPGHTSKARFVLGRNEGSHRVLWFDRPIAPGADGSLGPSAVPQAQVRLNTGAAIDHPHLASVPMQVQDRRTGTTVSINEAKVFVMFNPWQPRTMASAGAGQVIALAHAGKWSGAQETTAVSFGIERPVRELSLSDPLKVGDLAISTLLVRDNSRAAGIADMTDEAKSEDANEVTLPAVTVTAHSTGPKPAYLLTLGRDVLEQCDFITFDKAANQIQLSCEEPRL